MCLLLLDSHKKIRTLIVTKKLHVKKKVDNFFCFSLQETKVLVLGDSHLCGIIEFMPLMESKLYQQRINLHIKYKRGAYLNYAEEQIQHAHGVDIVVIMIGGNDLDSGAGPAYFEAYYHRIHNIARRLGIKSVVLTSI